MKSEKVLILGSNGYIGSALVEALIGRFEVQGCDRYPGINPNILSYVADYDDLLVTQLCWADTIILLAGDSSVASCKDFRQSYDQNVSKFQRLLDKIDGKGIKLIYASSSSVYSSIPVIESGGASEDMPLGLPLNNYDATKQIIDLIASRYMNSIEIYGLRFGTVNGPSPNMRWELILNSMIKSAIETGVIHVSNPDFYRPVYFMDNLIQDITTILKNNSPEPGIYNLCTINNTILEHANLVAICAERKGIPIKDLVIHNSWIKQDLVLKPYNFKISNIKCCKKLSMPVFRSDYHNIEDLEIMIMELKDKI